MSRVLAIDYGSKRIGLAISDAERRIASPLAVYARLEPLHDGRHFRQVIADEGVELLLVGLPVHMSGQEGGKAKEARQFGDWLAKATGLSTVYWDERFTTADAEQSMIEAGLTKQQRDKRRDMAAAQILLQSFLDAGCPHESPIPPLSDPSGRPRNVGSGEHQKEIE